MFSNESIKELGVAFIRRANGKELIEVCEELSNTIPLVPGVVVRYPLASFNRPALDLVKGAEVRHRQALERLSARSAVAKVLQDVPVLLEPYAGTKAMMFNHVETVTNSHGEQLVKLYAENDLRPQRERRWILSRRHRGRRSHLLGTTNATKRRWLSRSIICTKRSQTARITT
jgi:hypothetical protein